MHKRFLAPALVVGLAGTLLAGSLHSSLEQQIVGMKDQDWVKVLIVLKDQVDTQSLDWELHYKKAPLAERHRVVVERLQALAAETQPALLETLAQAEKQGQISDVTPHWLLNSIVLKTRVYHLSALAELDQVDIIEPNLVPELIEPVAQRDTGTREIGLAPGIDAIEAERVWYELGIWGNGALVANLDTGVDGDHPALASRWRGLSAPAAQCWKDVLGGGTTFPVDNGGHGTHVMGTITGQAPNDSIGVCPGAQWIACNAIDQGVSSGFDTDVLTAYEWFTDPDGFPETIEDVPDVIQNSWGVTTSMGYSACDSRWWNAIDNCEAAGVCVTWSAGNEGPSSQTLRSPGNRATTEYNCFSVGSTSYSSPYYVSDFSSRGPAPDACGTYSIKPEVMAPGSNIYSSYPGGGYTTMDGTSMAGPHVAGVVGLMRSANPNLDVITIKQILMDTASDLGTPGDDNTYGHGIVNAYEAVLSAMSGYGTVIGSVRDADTNAPLSGVYVEHSEGIPYATTGEFGDFSFMLPAGEHEFSFSRLGYLPQTVEIAVGNDSTTTIAITLQLAPSGVLHGYALDAYGEAMPGAAVKALDTPFDPVEADANGYYEMALPVGTPWLVVAEGPVSEVIQSPAGPDEYGYFAYGPEDTKTAMAIVNMVEEGLALNLQSHNRAAYDWTTIDPAAAGPGEALPFTLRNQTLQMDLPFEFVYYGEVFDRISICTNGWVALGETSETTRVGHGFGDPSEGPSAMIAPFWEDLTCEVEESGHISTWYDESGGRFIIEYNNIRQYLPVTAFETFQVILYDPTEHASITGDGSILMQHQTVSNTTYAAIGIESPLGTDGLTWYVGNPTLEPETNPLPASGDCVLFTTGLLESPISLHAVSDLRITQTARGQFILNWTAVPAAARYHVQRCDSQGTWTNVATVTEPSWTSAITEGVWQFRVIAAN